MKGPLKVKYVVKMIIMTGLFLFVMIILIKVSSELKNLNKLAESIEQKAKIGENFGLQSLYKIELESRYAMYCVSIFGSKGPSLISRKGLS